MKEVPIGVQDFKRLRDEGLCYVDRSAFIDRILGKGPSVFLFLRPRRFGKSLDLSMLDAYLSDKHPGNHWFDDLEIPKIRPDDPDNNSNPVIYLDMKGLGNGTYERFIYLLREKVVQLYIDALKPENATELEKRPELLFPSLDTEEGIARFTLSLSKLLKHVHDKSGKGAILIVGEIVAAHGKQDAGEQPSQIKGGTGPKQAGPFGFISELRRDEPRCDGLDPLHQRPVLVLLQGVLGGQRKELLIVQGWTMILSIF